MNTTIQTLSPRSLVAASLLLALLLAGTITSSGAEASRDPSIASSLAKLGLAGDCQIVIAKDADLVENTAAAILQRFLGRGGIRADLVTESKSSSKPRFLLGRESNHRALKQLGDKRSIHVRNISAEDDGYHVKRVGEDIVVAGANPRGVLYGVYAFEEFVKAGVTGRLDIRKVPYFRKRGSAPDYYWHPINATTEMLPEAKVEYLSRLGINEWTDQGVGLGGLSDFVASDVFPFQKSSQPKHQKTVRAMGALLKKYGIAFYPFLTEPMIPKLAGELEKYPKEALGKVKRPWGGETNGMEVTLCVSSPLVQSNLATMMRRFVREYPDVTGVHLYNMDSSAWLCMPALCERCKAVCTDSPPDGFNPWETQAKVVTLLAESARQANPDFDFRFWGPIHYHGKHFEKLAHATRGYGSMVGSWTGSDRTLMVPDAAVFDPSFVLSRKISEERGVPFYLVYEGNNLELTPRSLPFPFHVCDALKKYKKWGLKYLEEGAGPVPDHNTINSIVNRDFQWNPDLPVKKYLVNLSRRQFGEESGKWMYRAWQEMEKAFDVWDDVQSVPFALEGSQFHLCMGTAFGLPPAILPEVVKFYDDLLRILTNVEPWLAEGYERYKTPEFLEELTRMNAHFSRAREHARKAVAAASDQEVIGIYLYETPAGRPTRKQYAELNHASIAIGDALCRQRCNLVRAYIILKEMEVARAAGNQKALLENEKRYHALIREDIGAQEQFAELLSEFAKMQPCYTRTSLSDKEIATHLASTRDKIQKLKAYLATKGH